MKQAICALFILLAFASCKKEEAATKLAADYGCISRSSALARISAADSITVYGLMQFNHINSDSLVFYDYFSYWTLDDNLEYVFYQVATATQIKNGLPVFYGDVTYQFGDGYGGGQPNKYTGPVKLDTKPTFQFQKIRQLFLDESINKQRVNASYKDSCYTAQFGYFNLNKDNPYQPPMCTKAWKIHPQGSNYPVGYFRDDNGELIYFQIRER